MEGRIGKEAHVSITYREAGVDIAEGNRAVELIKESAASTFTSEVISGIGSFGSFYDISALTGSYRHPVLVQSIDGVGTKIILARMMGDFTHIGADLVSACCNDIAVHGARPLTFLDYIANDTLSPEIVADIVASIARSCRDIGVSLVGGETAEMPGTYLKGEHDLVGVVTGIVDRDEIINGSSISEGDTLIGVPSSGLHTNGYSLARAVLAHAQADITEAPLLNNGSRSPISLGSILLEPHLCYVQGIRRLLSRTDRVAGMAHITGGGLLENVPRILPEAVGAGIDADLWNKPFIFSYLQQHGEIPLDELYRSFNMGIGLVLVVKGGADRELQRIVEDSFGMHCPVIGRTYAGSRNVRISCADGEVHS